MEEWNVCFASILPECSFGANIMQFLVQVLESSITMVEVHGPVPDQTWDPVGGKEEIVLNISFMFCIPLFISVFSPSLFLQEL